MVNNEFFGYHVELEAIDDAYLYRFNEADYLLVVNAGNRDKDWAHLQEIGAAYEGLKMRDRSSEMAMVSLQGPLAKTLLQSLLPGGALPEPEKNALSKAFVSDVEVWLARTGYTGEPLGFELFIPPDRAVAICRALIE